MSSEDRLLIHELMAASYRAVLEKAAAANDLRSFMLVAPSWVVSSLITMSYWAGDVTTQTDS